MAEIVLERGFAAIVRGFRRRHAGELAALCVMGICGIMSTMRKLCENLPKVACWLWGAALLLPIAGCHDDCGDVLAAMERGGGACAFVSNCTQVAANEKQRNPENYSPFLIDADVAPELEKFCGMRPQLVVCNNDLGLLTMQLKGGFCHKGLVVSVSGEPLAENRAKQSSQAYERWHWKRVDDFIYWYEE